MRGLEGGDWKSADATRWSPTLRQVRFLGEEGAATLSSLPDITLLVNALNSFSPP